MAAGIINGKTIGGFDETIVANNYSEELTYTIGDLCVRNLTLYKALVDIETPEEWTPDHWSVTTVAAELKEGGTPAESTIAKSYDSTSTYNVGDFCIYNGYLYKCIEAITTPENFNINHWENTKVTDEFKNIDTGIVTLAKTLTAGSTTISFTHSLIGNTVKSICDIYTDLTYTTEITDNTLTLTFDTQTEDYDVVITLKEYSLSV
jgi:hypothetical protein